MLLASYIVTDPDAWHHCGHALSPELLAYLCVQVLKSTAVRNYANGLAYKNPALATNEAMRIGRLHTFLPGQLVNNRKSINNETDGS